MPIEMQLPTAWEPFLSFGSGGLVLLILWLLVRTGDLRTRFEGAAWEKRAERAEDQVDKLIPAVEVLADQTKELVGLTKNVVELVRQLVEKESREGIARGIRDDARDARADVREGRDRMRESRPAS